MEINALYDCKGKIVYSCLIYSVSNQVEMSKLSVGMNSGGVIMQKTFELPLSRIVLIYFFGFNSKTIWLV